MKFVSNLSKDRPDSKSKEFSVGFSTDDFTGIKIVGDNKESIGLCGDGKIHFMDGAGQQQAVEINNGNEL